jgi:hypothetical protein
VSQLASRFRENDQPAKVDRAVRISEPVLPNPRALPNDPTRLRGIPAIGRNVAGEVFGSRPDREVVRRLG